MNGERNKGGPAPSEIDSEEHTSSDDEAMENVVNHSQAVSSVKLKFVLNSRMMKYSMRANFHMPEFESQPTNRVNMPLVSFFFVQVQTTSFILLCLSGRLDKSMGRIHHYFRKRTQIYSFQLHIHQPLLPRLIKTIDQMRVVCQVIRILEIMNLVMITHITRYLFYFSNTCRVAYRVANKILLQFLLFFFCSLRKPQVQTT